MKIISSSRLTFIMSNKTSNVDTSVENEFVENIPCEEFHSTSKIIKYNYEKGGIFKSFNDTTCLEYQSTSIDWDDDTPSEYKYPEDDYMDDSEFEFETFLIERRILCWKNTLRTCKLLSPPPVSKKVVYIDNNNSIVKSGVKSTICVYNTDTIECAILHKLLNPLAVNIADDNIPGGWICSGSDAEEESIFRRTNYHQTLNSSFYPIFENEAVYSPGVSVIKTSEETDWELIPAKDIEKIDFIASPTLKYPDTFVVNGEDHLFPKEVAILKNKIRLIIQIAFNNNHRAIIFGAIGCGVWENTCKHVSEIFKEVLMEYDGVIPNYIFAIRSMLTESNILFQKNESNGISNYDVFSTTFTNPVSLPLVSIGDI